MSFFRRLFGRFQRPRKPPGADALDSEPATEETEELEQEALLAQMMDPSEQPRPLPQPARRLRQELARLAEDPLAREAADEQALLAEIEQVFRENEQLGLELLTQTVELLPDRADLTMHLAEVLVYRHDFMPTVKLLETLRAHPQHATKAHAMLGDHYLRQAELTRALQHFEEVLARDFSYPRIRRRADEIRAQLDRPIATAAPTILGGSDQSGGRYILQREIGQGGGGTVYLAMDKQLGRPLAVKVLHPHVARQAQARMHLFNEARIAASLAHPRIVAIYDLDEQRNLVAMEYCEGGTLASRITSGNGLEAEQALGRLVEMADVLSAVHRAGVVHRDIKPANWLLRRPENAPGARPALVLTDFGIAHAVSTHEDSEIAGSRAYMAPEQRLGAPADPRADLYACGVIFVELMLGRSALSHQQALQGIELLELDDIWQQLLDVLAEQTEDAELLAACENLARELVSPADSREADATSLGLRAQALRARFCQQRLTRELCAVAREKLGADLSAGQVERLRQAAHELC
jgi:hypothetical protein